jgi:hypothetical protein
VHYLIVEVQGCSARREKSFLMKLVVCQKIRSIFLILNPKKCIFNSK